MEMKEQMIQEGYRLVVEAQCSAGDDGGDADGDFVYHEKEGRAQQNVQATKITSWRSTLTIDASHYPLKSGLRTRPLKDCPKEKEY